jgi:hypothetical protein
MLTSLEELFYTVDALLGLRHEGRQDDDEISLWWEQADLAHCELENSFVWVLTASVESKRLSVKAVTFTLRGLGPISKMVEIAERSK